MIDLELLQYMNKDVCDRCNQVSSVINEDNLLSALSVQYWYPDDCLRSAALVRSLTIGHGFQDGNKRTAGCVGQFIKPYECTEQDIIDCIRTIATGELRDVEDIAAILYPDSYNPNDLITL